jgi:DNA-binding transcriptional ArsR family regulator
MPSSSSPSPDERHGLLRRFLVASRRGEIVALINSVRLEGDLGAVVATELCEAYDAEIGFVLIAQPGSTTAELIGSVGLIGDEQETILAQPSCREAMSGAVAVTERGTDLLGVGIRHLAMAPYTAGAAQLLVGVGRLYDQHFEELELALLEAVTKSAAQALERFGLEHQLQQAQEMEAVARLQVPPPGELGVSAVESEAPAELPLPLHPDLGSLAELFRLLGHPVRLRILLALGSETLSPSGLEQRLDGGLAVMAYHVRVLRDDGLLMLVDTRPVRGSLESFYRLTGRGEAARRVLAASWREIGDVAEQP